MMQKLLTSGINLIFCLRAKDKIDMSERDSTGKVIVRQLGWRPIQEKQFIYEMTVASRSRRNVRGGLTCGCLTRYTRGTGRYSRTVNS